MKIAASSVAQAQAVRPPALPAGNGRADKRERILTAALKLFAHQPYQEVTMDNVARQAGVAKGTLYLYFDSKEALYLGILSDGIEKAVRSNAIDPAADIAERLRRAIAISIQFYDEHRDFLRLLATEEPRLAAAPNRLLEGFRRRRFDFFSSLIEEGMASGIFRRADSRLATFAIMGAIRSVLLFYSEHRRVAEMSQGLAGIMLDGLMNNARNSKRTSAGK